VRVNSERRSPSTPIASPASPPTGDGKELRIQHSLFGEILDWMLMPLLLLWPLSIGVTYLIAKSIANEPFDRALEDRVTVLAQQVKEVNGKVSVHLPYSARDILRADDMDNVYFQVSGPRRELIAGDSDVPLPEEEDKPVAWSVMLRDAAMRNAEVRVAYTYVNLQATRTSGLRPDETRYALVQVAETLEKRRELANQIIKGVILPEFIILPIAITLLWFALSRGLSPLTTLQESIRSRRPDDLSPIDSRAVPEEISPLVRSLNDMLGRLSQSIESQKRFIADAAHQMKTPLAGMRMQSELAMRQSDRQEIQRSLEQLAKSSASATRLVNQLLALARAEAAPPELEPVDLAELARDVTQDFVAQALAQRIDLGYDGAQPGSPGVMVDGDPTLLKELVRNLVDNAINYTPSTEDKPGVITVRVLADRFSQVVVLQVEDSGPGIPPSERDLVFQPFYRALGTEADGSGLGLAIVQEIARQHGMQVQLISPLRGGRGTLVALRWAQV